MISGLFRISQWLVQGYFRLQFRLEVCGLEHVPRRGRLLFAANHISGYDPPVIGSVVPRALYFVAKKELFENRWLARLLRLYHCVPVDRAELGTSSVKLMDRLLQRGAAILLFPEGTRTKSGRLGPPKAGIGLLAVRNRADIVPVCIQGLYRVRGSFLRNRPHVRITFGEVVSVSDFVATGRGGKEVYLAIAETVRDRIQLLMAEPVPQAR